MIFQSDKSAGKVDFSFEKRKSKGGPATPSLIAEDLKITGTLESTGDITLEGSVDGHIKCRTLTIGNVPKLACDVEAETVHIGGVFSGDVRANKVVLEKTARVSGDIYHESLEVEEGATLEGRLSRLNDSRANQAGDDKVTHLAPVDAKTADTAAKAADADAETAEDSPPATAANAAGAKADQKKTDRQ